MQAARPETRQVSIGGRRVKTIDFHAPLRGAWSAGDDGRIKPRRSAHDRTERLQQMDAQGIDIEVLSINLSGTERTVRVSRKLIQAQNEKLAALCAPIRIDSSVLLQWRSSTRISLREQLEEGIKKFRLRGVSIGTEVGTEQLASPRFDPFWARRMS
jgi:aminocarboxymuconate-semialdehyde decarboxylase